MSKVKVPEIPTPRLIETPWGIQRRAGLKRLWGHLVKTSLNKDFSTEVILSAGLLKELELSRRTTVRFLQYFKDAGLIQKASRQLGTGRGILYRILWVENHARWYATKTKVLKKNLKTINDTSVVNTFRITTRSSFGDRRTIVKRESPFTPKTQRRSVFGEIPSDRELNECWEDLQVRVGQGLRKPALRRACQLVRLFAWREGFTIEEQRQFTNYVGAQTKRLEVKEIPILVDRVLQFIREQWPSERIKIWRAKQRVGVLNAKRTFFAILTHWVFSVRQLMHRDIDLKESKDPHVFVLKQQNVDFATEETQWDAENTSQSYLKNLSLKELNDFWREVHEGAKQERLLLAQKDVEVINVTLTCPSRPC